MIGLLDCNNFFVSCERLFRPDLAHKPVAVLSSNDGCVVARSQEVKDLGIPMGIPYFKVKDECKKEGITLFSGNITLYRDISARVMHTLRTLVDECEVYSVDEAFFALPDKNTFEAAKVVREAIMREIGIPVSIGVADTKTIAKYASEKVKKERISSGVCVLDLATWKDEMTNVSCGTIWGIGRQTTVKLGTHNITTVAELLNADRAFVRNEFGVVGERLCMELSGTQVRTGRDNDVGKSIMSSRSFKKETKYLSVLESAVGYHVSHIAEKLRERSCVTSRLYVTIRPNRFGDYALRKGNGEVMLEKPTSETQILLHEALALTRKLFDSEISYKKVGVTVGGVMPAEYQQPSIFDQDQKEDASDTNALALDTVLDTINTKFGSNTLHSGVIRNRNKWAASAELKSREYTTKWSEISFVKAI